MERVLITGGTGFVGGHLLKHLATLARYPLRASVRNPDQADHLKSLGCEVIHIGELSGITDWRAALTGVDCVIHCAGYAHEKKPGAESAHYHEEITVRGTLNLAQQAAAAGVKKFIFLSSIKVNGEATAPGQAFTAEDTPRPTTAYGQAKYQAELGLQEIARATGMAVVIIRPCLIYGPGAKANMSALMKCVAAGIPLPLGAVSNKRSFLSIDNLIHFILTCMTHPRAANEIFLASDGQDLSTPELITEIASAMGRKARLFSIPSGWLKSAAVILGRRNLYERLCGSLCVDLTKTKMLLDWEPPISVQRSMEKAIQKLDAR